MRSLFTTNCSFTEPFISLEVYNISHGIICNTQSFTKFDLLSLQALLLVLPLILQRHFLLFWVATHHPQIILLCTSYHLHRQWPCKQLYISGLIQDKILIKPDNNKLILTPEFPYALQHTISYHLLNYIFFWTNEQL